MNRAGLRHYCHRSEDTPRTHRTESPLNPGRFRGSRGRRWVGSGACRRSSSRRGSGPCGPVRQWRRVRRPSYKRKGRVAPPLTRTILVNSKRRGNSTLHHLAVGLMGPSWQISKRQMTRKKPDQYPSCPKPPRTHHTLFTSSVFIDSYKQPVEKQIG